MFSIVMSMLASEKENRIGFKQLLMIQEVNDAKNFHKRNLKNIKENLKTRDSLTEKSLSPVPSVRRF